MNRMKRGLILAVLQLLIVSSLGAKLLIDRARCPRVWVKTVSYDPDLPIRGRYASLRLVVQVPKTDLSRNRPFEKFRGFGFASERGRLEVRQGVLFAVHNEAGSISYGRWFGTDESEMFALAEPVAFFLSEKAADPTRRARGEELWAEVTVPRKGPPRPIRLAVKSSSGFQPLDLR
jgi:hypothetical protein